MIQRLFVSGRCFAVIACVVMSLNAIGSALRAADAAAEKPAAQPSAADAIRGLAGTWVSVTPAEKGQPPATLVFRITSGGTAVVETMLPGTKHEMVNVYSLDGANILMTHYCSMGNQPRMRLASMEQGVFQFQFVDCANIKSRDEAHMDSVELTVKGDHLAEKWAMYQDGKITGYHTFEFTRQK